MKTITNKMTLTRRNYKMQTFQTSKLNLKKSSRSCVPLSCSFQKGKGVMIDWPIAMVSGTLEPLVHKTSTFQRLRVKKPSGSCMPPPCLSIAMVSGTLEPLIHKTCAFQRLRVKKPSGSCMPPPCLFQKLQLIEFVEMNELIEVISSINSTRSIDSIKNRWPDIFA